MLVRSRAFIVPRKHWTTGRVIPHKGNVLVHKDGILKPAIQEHNELHC